MTSKRNPRDAHAGRKTPTTLELRVLRAAAGGDWMRAIAPGHGSRIYSQARSRLERMGLLSESGLVTILGAAALQEAGKK